MGKEKKWYQTGEFEDGYQFGDVFRTVKNAIDKDEEKLKANKDKTTRISQEKKETQSQKSNNVKNNFAEVESGRLKIDPAVRLYGFENERERQNYIKENPELYAAMGGVKYEPSVLSKNHIVLNVEEQNIDQAAIKKYKILQNEKSLNDKLTDELVSSAKKKTFIGEKLNVAEFGAVKSTNTTLINPKNRSEAYNLFKMEQLKSKARKYTLLVYNDDYTSSVNKAKNIDIDNSNITDKGTYKKIKSNKGIYQYMTDEEKDRYYYLVDKEDNAEIRNYILYIEPFLETRKAEDIAEKTEFVEVDSLGDIVKNIGNFQKRNAYSAVSGFSGAMTNMARAAVAGAWDNGLINSGDPLMNILDATYQEKLYSSISESAYDENLVYGLWLDVVNSTAAQIPEIAMGTAGGQGLYISGLFTKSLGANTTQAIQSGYDYDKGLWHSVVDTSLEVLPDMLTGTGITSLFGDGLGDYATKAVKWCEDVFDDPKVAKTISKAVIATGDNVAEGGQNFVQAMLEPTIRNIIYGESNEIDEQTFKEALKGFVIGFASSMPMTAISVNSKYDNSMLKNIGNVLKDNSAIESVIELAKYTETYTDEYSEIACAYDIGNEKNIDTATLGKLYFDAANEFVNPSENRLRNISKNAVSNIIEKAKEYEKSNVSHGLDAVRRFIKDRAIELGADDFTANEIAENIAGKKAVINEIVNSDTAQRIILELQEKGNKQADWVKRVNSILQTVRKNARQQDNSFENSDFVKQKTRQSINETEFMNGLWEDSPNNQKNIVEKSQLENVENVGENGIIEKTVDNDVGVPGVYTTTISWSIFKNLLARPNGAGYSTKKIKQHNPRVEAYEIKINPNKEGYHVKHPDGRYVQFENMKDGILQDGKLVMSKRSFYFVYDKGDFAKNRVLQQANRQVEVANAVGYKVEWLVSDEKAVEQISRLFKENKINITVKFYPE